MASVSRKRKKVKKKAEKKKQKPARKPSPPRKTKAKKPSDNTKAKAAKKAWETRRKKEAALIQKQHDQNEMARKMQAERLGQKYVPRKKKQRKKRVMKQDGPLANIARKPMRNQMERAQMMERLSDKMPGIFLPGWVETDESIMLQRLIEAEQDGVFDDAARNMAVEFDWHLRDVYELWHSPEVYF